MIISVNISYKEFTVRSFLHVMLLILFVVSMQGCSSTEKTEEAFVLETPQIESTTPSAESNVSEIVVHGKAGAVLTSLTLSADNTRLNKETNTTVKVMATFSDNSTKDVTQQVTWNMTPKNALRIDNRNLQAVNDGNVTLQATLGKIHSNSLAVNVFWEIHGYRLPPMPDEKLNNATLLGIDSNNNGVRDDVERWIYETYDTYIPCVRKDVYEDITLTSGEIKRIEFIEKVCEDKAVPYHQIVREIAMQGARAAQIIIVEPQKARETTKFMDAAVFCNIYFQVRAKDYNESIPIPKGIGIIGKEFDAVQFNTVQRARAYGEYNFALSGGVYGAPDDFRKECDFDVDALLGK